MDNKIHKGVEIDAIAKDNMINVGVKFFSLRKRNQTRSKGNNLEKQQPVTELDTKL